MAARATCAITGCVWGADSCHAANGPCAKAAPKVDGLSLNTSDFEFKLPTADNPLFPCCGPRTDKRTGVSHAIKEPWIEVRGGKESKPSERNPPAREVLYAWALRAFGAAYGGGAASHPQRSWCRGEPRQRSGRGERDSSVRNPPVSLDLAEERDSR